MYQTIKSAVKNFLRDDEGASGIEYALLAAMVAIALATFTPTISGKISSIFTKILDTLTAAT